MVRIDLSATWLSKEIPIAFRLGRVKRENVSWKWDWNLGPFNLKSSATTRAQACNLQFSYNLASYQGYLYTGIGTRLYTQSGQDLIGPYYSIKCVQWVIVRAQQVHTSGELLGTATSNSTCELPALRVLQWCADMKQDQVVPAALVHSLHWSTYKRARIRLGSTKLYNLHSYQSRVVKGEAPHS